MIIAVDTNIFIDVLNKDKKYFESSADLLNKALKQGTLIINEVVYAELARVLANSILTRDRGYYRVYFESLSLFPDLPR